MIGHKTSLNKFKNIEIISSIFSDLKEMKLETNLKEKKPKTLKNMDIESHAIKQWMGEKWDQRRNQKVSGNKQNELTTIQNLWNTVKAVLTGKFIAIKAYLKGIQTAEINNLTLHLQEPEEQRQRQPKYRK